jgi:hypothetical protein
MENEFDFNPAPILAKITVLVDKFDTLFDTIDSNRGKDGLDKLDKSVKQSSKSVDNFGRIGDMSLKKLLFVAGLLGTAFFALKSAFSSLPAVQDTFFYLGQIIKFNLLAPIMQDLLPALNSILMWADRNKTTFVEIGAIVGNVISTAITIIKQAVILWQRLFSGLVEKFREVFGTASQSIGDTLRLLMTKIVAGILFLQIAMEPVIDLLVDTFGFLLKAVQSFFQGFMSAFEGMEPTFNRLLTFLGNLFKGLTGLKSTSEFLLGVFKGIGFSIGFLIRTLLYAIDLIIRLSSATIEGVKMWIDFFKKLGNYFMEGVNRWINLFKRIGEIINTYIIEPVKFVLDWLAQQFDKFFGWFEKKWESFKGALPKVGNLFDKDKIRANSAKQLEQERVNLTTRSIQEKAKLSPVNNNNSNQKSINIKIDMPINQSINGNDAESVSTEISTKLNKKITDQLNAAFNRNQEAYGF